MKKIVENIQLIGVKTNMTDMESRGVIILNRISILIIVVYSIGFFVTLNKFDSYLISTLLFGIVFLTIISFFITKYINVQISKYIISVSFPIILTFSSAYFKSVGLTNNVILYMTPRIMITICLLIPVLVFGYRQFKQTIITSSIGILFFIFYDKIHLLFGVNFKDLTFEPQYNTIFVMVMILFLIFIIASIFFLQSLNLKSEQKLEKDIIQRKINEEKLNTALSLIQQKNDKITKSLNFAKKIQDSVLKPSKEISEIFDKSFVFFKPKDIVSGDFYWAKEFDNEKVIASVDCIGHGVPGAFMSLIVNTLLEKHVTKKNLTSTGRILDLIHGDLMNESKIDPTIQGMDISLCIIRENEKTINFSGAQSSGLIYNNGEFKTLKADPYSIGSEHESKINFSTTQHDIKKNDTLYLFSDGFIDQFGGEKHKKLNLNNFKNMISELEDIPLLKIRKHIAKYLKNWQGDIPQTDDILIFGVKLN